MDKQKTLDDKVAEKYKKAKELPPADIKLILLGDSAVGKSKYFYFALNFSDWLNASYSMTSKNFLWRFKTFKLKFICSEERTSSTHALTMYRHNTTVNGKEYKIGKYFFHF